MSEPTTTETVASLPAWAQRIIGELRTEAATHRTEATELRTERDTLRTQANERAASEALSGLSRVLTDPSDLTRYVDASTLLGDDGKPDPVKYLDAATALAGERPHLAPRAGASGGAVIGSPTERSSGPTDLDAEAAAGRASFAQMFNALD